MFASLNTYGSICSFAGEATVHVAVEGGVGREDSIQTFFRHDPSLYTHEKAAGNEGKWHLHLAKLPVPCPKFVHLIFGYLQYE